MWLLTTLFAALVITALHFGAKGLKKYQLDLLALMLWGTFVMVFVDHTIAFLEEGGDFISFTTDGLIESGLLLGIAMLVPLFIIWGIIAFTPVGAKIRAAQL